MSASSDYTKTPPVIDAELEIAFSERKAMRNSIFMLSIILVVMIVTLVILMRANTSIFPRQAFVYTANAASVCSFTPVSERGSVTDASIRNYAAQIAMELHALDYVNYRSTLNRVTEKYFTPEARVAATNALRDSNILAVVTEQGFVVRAVPRDTAVIESQGVNEEGVYQWVVRVPLVFAYTSRGTSGPQYRPENRDVTLTVIRVEQTAANPDGLMVSNMHSTQTLNSGQPGQQAPLGLGVTN